MIRPASQTLSADIQSLHHWLANSDRQTDDLAHIWFKCWQMKGLAFIEQSPPHRRAIDCIAFLRSEEQANQVRSKFAYCRKLADSIWRRIKPPRLIPDGDKKRIDKSTPCRVRKGADEERVKADYASLVRCVNELSTSLADVKTWLDGQLRGGTPAHLQPAAAWLAQKYRAFQAEKEMCEFSVGFSHVKAALASLPELTRFLTGLGLPAFATLEECLSLGWIGDPGISITGPENEPSSYAHVSEPLNINCAPGTIRLVAILPAVLEDAPGPGPEVIYFRGGQSYSLGEATPIVVSAEEHTVLSEFLKLDRALTTRELKVENPARVMKKLLQKFPGAIRTPGKMRGRGYHIHVRPKP